MAEITRENLAWAAGVWSGEGSATKSGYTRRAHLGQAGIFSEPPEMIQRLERIFGFGRVSGPRNYKPAPGVLKRKPMWEWVVSNFEEIQALAAFMWPWLTPEKQTQFLRVLANPPHQMGSRKWRKKK